MAERVCLTDLQRRFARRRFQALVAHVHATTLPTDHHVAPGHIDLELPIGFLL